MNRELHLLPLLLSVLTSFGFCLTLFTAWNIASAQQAVSGAPKQREPSAAAPQFADSTSETGETNETDEDDADVEEGIEEEKDDQPWRKFCDLAVRKYKIVDTKDKDIEIRPLPKPVFVHENPVDPFCKMDSGRLVDHSPY